MLATRAALSCLLIVAAGILGIASSAVDVQAFLEKLYSLDMGDNVKIPPETIKALQDEAFDVVDEKKKGYLEVSDLIDFMVNRVVPFVVEHERKKDLPADRYKLYMYNLTKDVEYVKKILPIIFSGGWNANRPGSFSQGWDANKDGKLDRVEFKKYSLLVLRLELSNEDIDGDWVARQMRG